MGSPPRLEREKELAGLRTALASASAGGGRTVLVEGVAGIGKTALIEAAWEAAGDRFEVGRGRGSEFEADHRLGLVRQILGSLAESRGEASVFDDADGFEAARSIYSLIERMAADRPLLIAADDVHLADPESLRVLAFVAHRAGSLPVAIVCAARPRPEWRHPGEVARLAGTRGTEVIRLGPLSREASGALIATVTGQSAGTASADARVVAAGGNPLYLKALLDESLVGESHDEPPDRAPEPVTRSVLERLRAGPSGATPVAVATAILGRGSLDPVAAVAGLSRDEARHSADFLRDTGLLADRAELQPAQPVLRPACLSIPPAGELAELHARAAAALRERGADRETVVGHLLRSEPAGDPEAVRDLTAAAASAASRGDPESEIRCLERALAEPPPEGERPGILLALGLAEGRLRRPGATGHLTRAIELSPDPDERLAAAAGLWTHDSFDGHYEEGMRVLRRALEEPGGDPDLRLRVELEVARGLRSSLATAAEGRKRIDDLRARAWDPDRPLERLALGLIALDDLFAGSPAADLASAAERILPPTPDPAGTDRSQLDHIPYYLLIYADRLDLARERLEEMILAADSRGSTIGRDIGMLWRSLVSLRQGRLTEAEADSRTVLARTAESRWRFGAAAAGHFLAEALIERGDLDQAAALYEERPEADIPERGWTTHLSYGRARVALERGEAAAALDGMIEVGRLERVFLAERPAMLPWRSEASRAALAVGDRALARRLASEEVELCRAFGAPRPLGIALRARGLAVGGEAGIADLAESAASLRGSGSALELGRSLVELGAAKRRAGLRAEARGDLRDGLDLASDCGARRLAERARDELAASGARLRRERVRGPESLTASELRVARLAAEGRSNPDIARDLYVSRKTVEKHLASAYTKLEITSRRELAATLPKE